MKIAGWHRTETEIGAVSWENDYTDEYILIEDQRSIGLGWEVASYHADGEKAESLYYGDTKEDAREYAIETLKLHEHGLNAPAEDVYNLFGDDSQEHRDKLLQWLEDPEIGPVELEVTPYRKCHKDVFSEDTELPVFQSAKNSGRGYVFCYVCIKTYDFYRVQAYFAISGDPDDLLTYRRSVHEGTVEGMMDAYEEGGEQIPIPFIEFNSSGSPKHEQEGRHRAETALRMDFEYIPVLLAQATS
jgi:hypothetical protein